MCCTHPAMRMGCRCTWRLCNNQQKYSTNAQKFTTGCIQALLLTHGVVQKQYFCIGNIGQLRAPLVGHHPPAPLCQQCREGRPSERLTWCVHSSSLHTVVTYPPHAPFTALALQLLGRRRLQLGPMGCRQLAWGSRTVCLQPPRPAAVPPLHAAPRSSGGSLG